MAIVSPSQNPDKLFHFQAKILTASVDYQVTDPDPWYVKAWNSYIGNLRLTAKVINMDPDTSKPIWHRDLTRGIISDNIAIEFNMTSATIIGGSATYSINFLTRGPDWGFHLSRTFQNSYGIEWGFGANLGMYHYSGNPNDMRANDISGRTDTYSGSFGTGGNITIGYSPSGTVLWSGASGGIGLSGGGSYNTGIRYLGW